MKKPFDQRLYKADDNAKYQVIRWLNGRGYDAVVNPDQYGIDVLATRDGVTLGFEVEVKHNWTGADFNFPNVHFSARKLKFARHDSYFTMLNNERSHVLVVTGEAVLFSPVVSKATKYTDSEDFVEVDLADCRIFPC